MFPGADSLIVLAAKLDGRYSQVHRQLRGTGFSMIGAHGIAGETGFHGSMEDAVMHALDHHHSSPEGATPERTDAAGPIPQQDQRRQCRPPRPEAK